MQVERETVLKVLESLVPGLSKQDIVEQSACIVVTKGTAMTFNDNIACSCPAADLPWEGAINAEKLLQCLRTLTEKTIDITTENDGSTLIVKGARRRAEIKLAAEILLPVDSIDQPKTNWKPLPQGFLEGLRYVQSCASRNEATFDLTCVHFTPTHIEACDAHQLARYTMELPIAENCLLRRESIKYLHTLDVQEVNETRSWMHFRNKSGLVISCRRFAEQYRDMGPILKVKGSPVVLPKNIKAAAQWAKIWATDNPDSVVTVSLRNNKIRIAGESSNGKGWEFQNAQYSGPPISFGMSPDLLGELVDMNPKCQIEGNKLKLQMGKYFEYVTALLVVKQKVIVANGKSMKVSKKKVKP